MVMEDTLLANSCTHGDIPSTPLRDMTVHMTVMSVAGEFNVLYVYE
jgi:hypothetical protein